MDAAWTCPTCKTAAPSRFCPTCGEEALRPRHLTLPDLAHQLAVAFTSVDGKLLRSLRALLLRPGELTAAYVAGRRKPFLGPLSLFLIANGLFFAVQSSARTNIFASSLDSHLHHQDWSGPAQALVARHLSATQTTLEAYARIFDQAAELNAKSLIILMVLAFSILQPIVFLRDRRPLAAHVVFALHLYTFVLLLFSLELAAVSASQALGGPGLEAEVVDWAVSLLNLGCFAVYLAYAIPRAYGVSRVRRLAAAILAFVVAALVPAYRFAIFLITLWTT